MQSKYLARISNENKVKDEDETIEQVLGEMMTHRGQNRREPENFFELLELRSQEMRHVGQQRSADQLATSADSQRHDQDRGYWTKKHSGPP